MGGILGRLLHEFAVTIIVAVLISGFVSLTVDADDVQPHPQAARRRQAREALPRERAGVRCGAGRLRIEPKMGARSPAARHSGVSRVVVATAALYSKMPKGFLPSEDAGQLFCFIEAPQDISFDAMVTYQRSVLEILRADPTSKA